MNKSNRRNNTITHIKWDIDTHYKRWDKKKMIYRIKKCVNNQIT